MASRSSANRVCHQPDDMAYLEFRHAFDDNGSRLRATLTCLAGPLGISGTGTLLWLISQLFESRQSDGARMPLVAKYLAFIMVRMCWPKPLTQLDPAS